MKDMRLLPLTATNGQIVQAIQTIQAKAKAGRVNEWDLAARVCEELERLDGLAKHLGLELLALSPSGTIALDHTASTTTYVEVNPTRLMVRRGRPTARVAVPSPIALGSVVLTLPPVTR